MHTLLVFITGGLVKLEILFEADSPSCCSSLYFSNLPKNHNFRIPIRY